MCLTLLNLIKGCIQDELDQFFSSLRGEQVDKRIVTDSAFCQARRKLSHTAFIALNDDLIQEIDEHLPGSLWRGFRLLAVDGTTLRLPKTEAIRQHFGQNNDGVPLAQVSHCIDLHSRISRSTLVAPYKTCEREMAIGHFAKTSDKDLLIYDRGYHGFFMFALHRHQNRHFCMRLPAGQYIEMNAFLASGKKESIATFTPQPKAKRRCQALGISHEGITLRMIRIELSSGEIEVLATSVLDAEQFPHAEFAWLYHQRWGVESHIHHLKQPLEIENFTGLSVEAALQDIYAKLLMDNIVGLAKMMVQPRVDEQCQERQLDYKINATQALSKAKHLIAKVALWPLKKAASLVEDFMAILGKCLIPIRPGRSYSRKHKVNKRVFHNNIKRAR